MSNTARVLDDPFGVIDDPNRSATQTRVAKSANDALNSSMASVLGRLTGGQRVSTSPPQSIRLISPSIRPMRIYKVHGKSGCEDSARSRIGIGPNRGMHSDQFGFSYLARSNGPLDETGGCSVEKSLFACGRVAPTPHVVNPGRHGKRSGQSNERGHPIDRCA